MNLCLRNVAQATNSAVQSISESIREKLYANAPANRRGSGRRERPCATSDRLAARVAVPDADSLALHGVLQYISAFPSISISFVFAHLAAEGAGVACVLGDFHLCNLLAIIFIKYPLRTHLFDLLAQGRTVTLQHH